MIISAKYFTSFFYFFQSAQGGYIDKVGSYCTSKKGILFGTFYSFMATSAVVGSFISTGLLNIFGSTMFFIINTIFSLISAYLMFRIPSPESINFQEPIKHP